MIYVTSDLHGHMDCLEKLLAHVNFCGGDWLYIIGDVIDRNQNGGVDILKWLLVQPNVQLIKGNHELMMLNNRWLFEEVTEESINELSADHLRLLNHWRRNGGQITMNALRKEPKETVQDVLDYVVDCPLYESVSAGDRNYLLVHGGLGNFEAGKKMSEYTTHDLVWTRPTLETVYDLGGVTLIIGHTPTRHYGEVYENRMVKTSSWWNIDTGAARSTGRPMLLCLDDLTEYYIEEDGSVAEVRAESE